MSAKFLKDDSRWLLNNITGKLTDAEEALLQTAFDSETEQDIKLIEKEIKNIKFLKRVCFIKLALFVPEYSLTLLLFQKKYSTSKKELATLYYKFLFNKISLEDFKIKLKSLMKDGII